jgi:hypothetical protein
VFPIQQPQESLFSAMRSKHLSKRRISNTKPEYLRGGAAAFDGKRKVMWEAAAASTPRS